MFESNTKLGIKFSNRFKKQYKKLLTQGKDKQKFKEVIFKLANLENLEPKYKNHDLNDSKRYKDCKECHIEPDWLLVYKYIENKLVLLLVETGSHSELF